ncbi:MAG: hypothetical protein IKY71_06140 [Bacteroidaceae bacterium]|nr:hypothetical protein [Bacteroidaceae bacterium]
MEKVILEEMKQRVVRRISAIEGDINEYKEKFNDDYEKFLVWYAEDLYKCKLMHRHYSSLLTTIEIGGLSSLKEALRHTVEHFSDDILYGSLRKSSTNNFANLTHVLELEVKQKIVRSFASFLREIAVLENKKQ